MSTTEAPRRDKQPAWRRRLRIARWRGIREIQHKDVVAHAIEEAALSGRYIFMIVMSCGIAILGLLLSSPAVIIGAMLISPLMGPIVGVGYGAAISDVSLMRTSAITLLGFTLVSLLTSVIYFSLSPLSEPGSELMARTTPNLWDVLIAAFGGAAGMVAATRRSFTNIAPGVAIATALMPPLCTVGFGIAHQRWDMALGASYLFLINSVFIASSTLLVGKILRLPKLQELSASTVKIHRWVISACLVAVVVPSIWLGYRLVQIEFFRSAATAAVKSIMQAERSVVQRDIQVAERRVSLVVVGVVDQEALKARALRALEQRGIKQVEVVVLRPDSALWEEQRERASARDDEMHLLMSRINDLQQQLTTMQQALAESKSQVTPHHSAAPHKGK